MMRMGDRRGLGTLVDGLEDLDPLVRARAILVLKEGTGETFEYRADDNPVDRSAAVARWRFWLQRTSAGNGG
jgi:HEAT repeat protein